MLTFSDSQHVANYLVNILKLNDVIYGQLWLYFFVFSIYFAVNLDNEQYTGESIMNTPIGISTEFGSRCFYWIFTASIVSITLGCTTLLDLLFYPPSRTKLNRKLLSISFFMPVAIIIVFARNLRTYLPIVVVMVHACQLAVCTACILDFLRKIYPSTLTDRLSGAMTFTLLTCFLCGQIGFGDDYSDATHIVSESIAGAYFLLVVYTMYKYMYDEAAFSQFTMEPWEQLTLNTLICPWALVMAISMFVGLRHKGKLVDVNPFDIKLCDWSRITFVSGVFVCLRYSDKQCKAEEDRTEMLQHKVTSEINAEETK